MSKDLLRKLPSVDRVLSAPASKELQENSGRELFAQCLRETLEELRGRLRAGEEPAIDEPAILELVSARVAAKRRPGLCRAINATGIILHTGLGRAVLPKSALEAIVSEQKGYSLLEVERSSGERSIRETHIVGLLQGITGAEAATVVNNNAGATLLALAALARGREVITSRGQLVEIGGSFRIPEVMEQSGAKLVEVGTTNKTYIEDYERNINPDTALLLRVHTSNYRIVGFTHFPSLEELVELGKRRGVPVMDDLGSGAFVDLRPYGIEGEPTVQESIRAGADVVTFSGDKLLGGPQAGFVVGKKESVSKIRRHPLFRALRVDKLKLTAMEATLKLYLDPDRLRAEHPTLRMISMGADEIEKRALDLAAKLQGVSDLAVEIVPDTSEVGGGSVPAQQLPTRVVAVRSASISLDELAARLRAGTPCVFSRVQRERVLFDVRTLQDGEIDELAAAVRQAAS